MKNKIPILSVYDENGNRLEIPAIVGRSAYQDAVRRGYQGSVDDWLKSLRGEKGDPGENYNLTEADKEEIAGMISGGGATGNVLILVSGTSLDSLRIEFVSPPTGVSVNEAYELISRGLFDVAMQMYSDDGNDLTSAGLLQGMSDGDAVAAIGEFWSDGNVSLVNMTLDIAAMTAYAEVMYTASGGTSIDEIYILGEEETVEDAPDTAKEIIDPYDDAKPVDLGQFATKEDLRELSGEIVDHAVWYGESPTDKTQPTKIVNTTTGDFKLQKGARIFVKFLANTGMGNSLNVDGTGVVYVHAIHNGDEELDPEVVPTMWNNIGQIQAFTYDGKYFIVDDCIRATADNGLFGKVGVSDSVTLDSGNTVASSKAVKTAYDKAVEALGAVPSDEHINSLIDTALGVIENGTY